MTANTKDAIARHLGEARRRTLELIEPLEDEQLNRVYSEILSPLAWDLGHIANFEELWLVQRIGGRDPLHGELGRYYDAIENPRATRGELPILRGSDLRSYLADVRERTLEVLEEVEIGADSPDPLLRDGFVYEMLLAHEHQHNETMLQLLQMVEGYRPTRIERPAAVAAEAGPEMVRVEGGEHEIGAGDFGFAYDNERRRHVVELSPFEIDRTPVSNRAYLEFIEETGGPAPLYWEREGGEWVRNAMGRHPVDPDHPVVHVSHTEAEAFAAWAGKRLPTEQEWEVACAGASRDYANLDQLAFGPVAAGSFAEAPTECGAVQMLGDVWEWTASDFLPYPGFNPFPYGEYSEAFFGSDYRVLRGGSWATRRRTIRSSFRNWDLPERRQIFSGIRCAKDI